MAGVERGAVAFSKTGDPQLATCRTIWHPTRRTEEKAAMTITVATHRYKPMTAEMCPAGSVSDDWR
jgi:hypothetical protein